MTFEEYMASIREDVLKYRRMTNELYIKREKSREELDDYANLNKQVLDKISELRNASDSEAKEELESWLKEESDYVALIRTLSDNFMAINKEINDINNEHYNKIVMYLDLLDERDKIKREILDIEKASLELDENYVACLDANEKKNFIHYDFVKRYLWLVSREKEIDSHLHDLSKEIYNGEKLENNNVKENSVVQKHDDNASLTQDILFYNNKINEILKGKGRKCRVKYHGNVFEIPRAKRGAFLNYMHRLDVLMKKSDDLNKREVVDKQEEQTKALVVVNNDKKEDKALTIVKKRKPEKGVVKKIRSFIKRNKAMIAAAVMTIVVVANGLFSLPAKGVDKSKVNDDNKTTTSSMSSQDAMDLFKDTLPYDVPEIGDLDEIIAEVKAEENKEQAKMDTNDIRIGNTVTINDNARIYVTAMDAINEINQYRPREENTGKDRVVTGVTVDVEGNRVNLFANQENVNEQIDTLVNGGGKIVSVLTSIKDDLPEFNEGSMLSANEINDKSEGFYNINSVNVNTMERMHVR